MNAPLMTQFRTEVEYAESDGQPMADNTIQFRLMVTIQGGLSTQYQDDPNVFIAGDLFWYPEEGNNKIRTAPDVMAIFGVPKGDRPSYLQWAEGNIPPQVVFEIWSRGNRPGEMVRKFQFYERYGVEEYYLYDPAVNELTGWIRDGDRLREIENIESWVSPRLKIRFDLSQGELKIIGANGKPFLTYVELAEQRMLEQQEKEKERQEKEKERQEKEKERQEKEKEKSRADRLAAQLRALGVDPEV